MYSDKCLCLEATNPQISTLKLKNSLLGYPYIKGVPFFPSIIQKILLFYLRTLHKLLPFVDFIL